MQSYQFNLNQPPCKSVKAVASSILEDASAVLGSKEDKTTIVHEARKCIKRERALLRLLKPVLEPASIQQADDHFKAMGKQMASARDAAILVKTLQELREEGFKRRKPPILKKTMVKLKQEQYEAERSFFKQKGDKTVAKDAKRARRMINRWRLRRAQWGDLLTGMANLTQKAKDRWAKVQEEDHDQQLHDFRKQVKYLQYGIEFFHPLAPEELLVFYHKLDDLSSTLGNHHDLAVLKTSMIKEGKDPKVMNAIKQGQRLLYEEIQAKAGIVITLDPAALKDWMASRLP